jgi:hypothetical protein
MMDKAKVTFTRCVLSSIEETPEWSESKGTVYFTVEHEGKRIEDSVDFVRRTGPKLERGRIELKQPEQTTILNQEDFAVRALDYVQDLVLAEGAPVGDTAQPRGVSGTREGRGHEQGTVYARTVTVEVAVREAVPMQPTQLA